MGVDRHAAEGFGRALSEIHRVLRPAGGLGLIWNRRDTRDPRQAAIDAIIRPYRRRAPTHERDQWREPMLASTLFRPADERRFRHKQTVDLDGLIDRVLSIRLPYLTDVLLFRRR